MKLEFLNDISDGGKYPWADPNQLIRLYDFNSNQSELFRNSIQDTILQKGETLTINTLKFIQPINCSLQLRISNTDVGISTNDNQSFFCDLTLESYYRIVELLTPFCRNEMNGYQWLYDIDTPIDFLYSPGGTW